MANPVALITGATGQDGAYLSELLLGKGYIVLQASAVAILAQLQYAALRYHKSSNNQRAVYSDHANL